MCKIKEYYDKERSKDISHYLRKLQSLKSKSIDESSEILREITEIFEILHDKNYKLGTMEKMKYIYYALPNEVRCRLKLNSKTEIDVFINDVKEQINVLQYFLGKGPGKENNSTKIEDLMDIDYVTKIKSHGPFSKENKIKREDNHCYICEMKGHTTDKCKLNLKTHRERKEFHRYNKNNNKMNNKRRYIDWKCRTK